MSDVKYDLEYNDNVGKTVSIVLRWVFFIGIFMMPFIFWPWASISFEIPRVFFVQRWVEMLLFIGALSLPLRKNLPKIDRRVFMLLMGFGIVAILATVLGVDIHKSIVGNYYRGDGLIMVFHMIGLAIFLSLFWEKSWERVTFTAIRLSTIIISCWTIILAVALYLFAQKGIDIWGNGAIGATFGNPHLLTGYLVVTLPFTVMYIFYSKKGVRRFIWSIFSFMQIAAIILTRSWAGVVGILLFILLSVWVRKNQYTMIISTIIVFILFVTGFFYIQRYSEKGFLPEGRDRIFHKLLVSVGKRPILGWGWANVDYAFDASDWPIHLGHDVYVDKAHGMFWEVLTTTGMVGLLTYLLLVIGVGKRLYRISRENKNIKILFICFVLYILHSQMNVISIGEEIFFWLITGLAMRA